MANGSGGSSYKRVRNNPGIYRREGKRSRENTYAVRDGPKHWVGTYGSLKEAQQVQDELKRRKRDSGSGRSSRVRVGEFAADWLLDPSDELADSTRSTYRHGVSDFVKVFGATKARELDAYDCREWARRAPPSAVKATRIMLNKMVSDQILAINPLAGFKVGRQPGRKNWPILGDDEVEMLIDVAANSSAIKTPLYRIRIAGIVSLGASLGLRVSEILALTHQDIDLDARTVRVERQISRKGEVVPLKTDACRSIALTPRASETLRSFPSNGDFLYPKRNGVPFTRGSFGYHFSKVVAASGIPGLQFHELRHYLATWLMHQKVPPWAIDFQLGHESGLNATQAFETFGFEILAGLKVEPEADEVSKLYRHSDAIGVVAIHEALASEPKRLVPIRKRSEFVPPERRNGRAQ